MKIILDTNFLIYTAKEKIDYIEELSNLLNEDYQLVVPEKVVKELTSLKNDKLKKVSGKDKHAADLALKLLKSNKIKEIKTKGKTVDESIINLSKENKKNIVCTLDREMRKTLGRVILLNKNKQLILTS
ncbi:ribonuclease VapC [Candidatus Pacearchaeota archaeon]|nr:ribonuclease VapC [Candidatus Pacearchaeota archaeon]|tara:strand:+ start:142 stop:528 length:387 start_codon:yes stop_codon:yes gene_type:complete